MRSSKRNLFQWLWALPVMFVLVMSSQANAEGKSLKFEVTVTNFSSGHIGPELGVYNDARANRNIYANMYKVAEKNHSP